MQNNDFSRYCLLSEAMFRLSREMPDDPAIVFIYDDGTEQIITRKEFQEMAARFARKLNDEAVRPGDVVVLIHQHSPELLAAFWGILFSGAVPAILPYLTEKLNPELYFERIVSLVKYSHARTVITFPEFRNRLARIGKQLDCSVPDFSRMKEESDSTLADPYSGSPGDLALLVHSSGSTGMQKGVALTHRAVLNHLSSFADAIQLTSRDIVVSWAPLYHDGGLIMGFLLPLLQGCTLVIMSPFRWVKDPIVYLRAIQRHKGTVSWTPNFALHHSVRGIRDRNLKELDLSCLRVLVNAAEPVREESQRLFSDRFGKYGFRETVFAPAYGMAENTCVATIHPPGRVPYVDWIDLARLQTEGMAVPLDPKSRGAVPFIGCGAPLRGVEVRVVDRKGNRLPDRRIGEIQIRSDSLFSGYFGRPDLTAEVMKEDGWYASGDLGYVADHQLFISGRKKDLIIVGGKNIYPQDVEQIANGIEGIHPGRVVAFGVPDKQMGTESIVVLCEPECNAGGRKRAQIEKELRFQIAQRLDVAVGSVCFVSRQWLIKTSSGKIARSDNRNRYLAGLCTGDTI